MPWSPARRRGKRADEEDFGVFFFLDFLFLRAQEVRLAASSRARLAAASCRMSSSSPSTARMKAEARTSGTSSPSGGNTGLSTSSKPIPVCRLISPLRPRLQQCRRPRPTERGHAPVLRRKNMGGGGGASSGAWTCTSTRAPRPGLLRALGAVVHALGQSHRDGLSFVP